MPKDSPRVDATPSAVILSYNSSIKEAKHSVVNISTTKKTKQNDQLNELMQNPFFKESYEILTDQSLDHGDRRHSPSAHRIQSGPAAAIQRARQLGRPVPAVVETVLSEGKSEQPHGGNSAQSIHSVASFRLAITPI